MSPANVGIYSTYKNQLSLTNIIQFKSKNNMFNRTNDLSISSIYQVLVKSVSIEEQCGEHAQCV